MEHFIINSSACLFVLWLFYKLVLENTSWHQWKRYYLLGAVIVSITIPFIVVQTIIIPIESSPLVEFASSEMVTEIIEEQSFEVNWNSILMAIYSSGFLIMLWRFVKNFRTFSIQSDDEVIGYASYKLILRHVLTVPHSFLERIFVSKKEYENNQIPDAVLKHEKAHLDQKHSWDILFVEILLILFWFNPLFYLLRYSIKLNHEFLADRAVIQQGTNTLEYQETLLQYTSQSHSAALANTFNFPIIKKRFTIMKTKTSNTSLILRSLALLPVLALLVISCGKEETEFIEVEETIIEVVEVEETNQKLIVVDPNDPEGNINIDGETHYYKIKGDQIEIYNKSGELQDFESQGYEVREAEVIEVIEILENLTSKDIEEYNHLARRHQEFIKERGHAVLFNEDSNRMKIIFNTMSDEQRAANEPWPYLNWENNIQAGELPPPPPAPTKNSGFIKVDQKIYRYTLKENDNNFYDHKGNVIDVYGKTVEYVKKEDLPPPPPPADPLDYINSKGDDMNYYIDDVKVNAAKAKAFIQKNGKKGVQIMPVNGVYSLKMFTKSNDKRLGVKGGTWEDVSYFLKEGARKSPKESKPNTTIEKDQDRKDYNSRVQILRVSLEQKSPITYSLNNRTATHKEIYSFITENHDCDVTLNDRNRILHFQDRTNQKMNSKELQNVYTKLFQERKPKNEPEFVAISETEWKVITVDATVSKGAFKRKGVNYNYDSSDLNKIKVYKNGTLLNEKEHNDLAVGFSIIWWKGEQKYKELLKTPEVIEGIKNGTYAVFYRVNNKSTYTKNYKEALKVDASNSFLRMGSTLESTTINLIPHSWAYTNPSLKQFQKYLNK